MSLWEYKVISSGKGGFATPALLEKFLNDLGREDWEIIEFRTPPDNPLAFSGLARRTTQRDWTLEDAAAAAAKVEADKLRAEFEAKFKAATAPTPVAEEKPASFLEEKAAPEDGFRRPVDTSRDDEPEAVEEEKDEWDKLVAAEEEELPTFFEAIKPHMRRNQRGPGMSVGVDYLAKKWDQSEDDIKGALVECGFVLPEDEDSKAEYLEYDGDLYWLNINRRGELWINTKEKPRAVFRAVKGQRHVVEEEPAKPAQAAVSSDSAVAPAAEGGAPAQPAPEAQPDTPPVPLPTGLALLDVLRPHMRRNRRGPGASGSTSFLTRALRCTEADLRAGFAAVGLVIPEKPNDRPINTVIGEEVWWLNADSRGGLWINGREKRPGENVGAEAASQAAVEASPATPAVDASVPVEASAPAPVAESLPAPAASAPEVSPAAAGAVADAAPAAPRDPAAVLAGVRLLLKPTRTGGAAAKIENLAADLSQEVATLQSALVAAGLSVPEKAREKPVFVEHAGEIFWFNRNAKGELWVNAKASKYADQDSSPEDGDDEEGGEDDAEKKPRRPRPKKKS
jgi:hypothetical protein